MTMACPQRIWTIWLIISLSLAVIGRSPAFADVPPQMPGVSFSPTVINFGQIPSGEQPTQLLTVIFDRRMFPSNHLPTLRSLSENGTKLTLFSRFDGPKTIRVVYRVSVNSSDEVGPFHDNLTLIRDRAISKEDDATVAVEDDGVLIKGEFVQGLNVDTKFVDFGPVEHGKGAAQDFRVGIFRSNFISRDELNQNRIKPKADAPPTSPSLRNMSVTSSSPYITASNKREMGLNGSSWVTWQIFLGPTTPVGFLNAELVFTTDNGYSITIPVRADVRELTPAEKH